MLTTPMAWDLGREFHPEPASRLSPRALRRGRQSESRVQVSGNQGAGAKHPIRGPGMPVEYSHVPNAQASHGV